MKKFAGKSILISGACGTIGTQLVSELLTSLDCAPSKLVCIDNNESEIFYLDQLYLDDPRAQFFVADIADRHALTELMRGIEIVFHAAALKHVTLCERSPEQALRTNIYGVQNIIAASNANCVETVIFTSSDKAVNPTNVMGTSKLLGERLMTAADSNKRQGGPVFASTRFGNVLGSNGSVVPIFHRQIAQGGPITLTDRSMTRFVMSVQEAVRLILDSAEMARGGEVFVTKMPAMRIEDLAFTMIEELAPRYNLDPEKIEVIEIGVKPGEKLYEELMNSEETRRTVELKKYFCVMPALRGEAHQVTCGYPNIVRTAVIEPYVSHMEKPLTKDEIKAFLKCNGLLN